MLPLPAPSTVLINAYVFTYPTVPVLIIVKPPVTKNVFRRRKKAQSQVERKQST